jgi:hypothetical protein
MLFEEMIKKKVTGGNQENVTDKKITEKWTIKNKCTQ